MQLEDRKLKEIAHSDRRRSIVRAHEYTTDAGRDRRGGAPVEWDGEWERHFSNMKFYSIAQRSFDHRDALVFGDIKGKVALDYCCGNGEVAVEMARRGASKAVGIDISAVAVENARALARAAGVDAICQFEVMDAEHTDFADGTFDVVHEYGALHHLALEAAYRELARIIKPRGKLVCTEALRHNAFIHWYRRRTPHLRTAWEVEHILGIPEIERARGYFGSVTVRTFHLAALAAVPFRKGLLFQPLLSCLNVMDRLILALPGFRRLAWIAVVECRQPIK